MILFFVLFLLSFRTALVDNIVVVTDGGFICQSLRSLDCFLWCHDALAGGEGANSI